MEDLILVLNAGSSSLKFAVYQDSLGDVQEICSGQAEGLFSRPRFVVRLEDETQDTPLYGQGHGAAVQHLAEWLRARFAGRPLLAVGHRVAHGGDSFDRPVRITPPMLDTLQRLVPLAPLHQPHNLGPIRMLAELMPRVPQVACFDTAFHRTMPRLETLYALPGPLIDEGVRRYGFHGLSYEYISRRLRDLAPALREGRVVVAHLGSGASMCAMENGRSVATTMGFTALDGLPMGTRCGSLDPGIVLYLMDAKGMSLRDVEEMLYKNSGLLGLSGISADLRVLLESTQDRAFEAVDFFVHRAARELASLAASLGGLDGLVFTAGIGEHSAPVRAAICRKAAWLGIELDEWANDNGERTISATGSRVTVMVVPTDENRIIAEQVVETLNG
jgi:acetate kinase